MTQIRNFLKNLKIITKSFRSFEIGNWILFGIWNLGFGI